MTPRFQVLLHAPFYSALRVLPGEERSRFRRLVQRLASGEWGGGTRVKKLRGCPKPVFEARHDAGDRVLFTLARSAAPDGSGRLAPFLQIWDLVHHDRVDGRAARINRSAEAEFLEYEEIESEIITGPPPHAEARFDEIPGAEPGAEAGVIDLMLPPDGFEHVAREEIVGGVRFYLLPDKLLIEEPEWQSLMDRGGEELELKMTAEQYSVVRAPGPVLLSGSAGSGKTTIAVHRLAAATCGPSPRRALYLTYSRWLLDHARRLFGDLVLLRGTPPAVPPQFLTIDDLYRTLVGWSGTGEGVGGGRGMTNGKTGGASGGEPGDTISRSIGSAGSGDRGAGSGFGRTRSPSQGARRLADYPEFTRWYAGRFRRQDSALAWEEIRSIVKGACLDPRRAMLGRGEYEALGRKRAPLFVSERARLFEVARKWQEHLDAQRLVDEIDLCRLALASADRVDRYDHLICDEAQDLAEIQMELLLKLHDGPGLEGLFLAGDPQQVINPSGFRWAEVRTAILERRGRTNRPPPPVSVLTRNFRSVRGLVDLANEVLAMKRERTGRSEGDEAEESVVAGAAPVRVEGDEASLARTATGFGPRCAVLVGAASERDRLQALLGTSRIFTVPEAKGLEFDVVILWGFVASDPAPWLALLDLGRDLREDPACRRALHHLYVALTRARRHLAVYEPPGAPALWTSARFAARLDIESPDSLDRLFARSASPAEWLREGDYFLERGRHRQAAECFRRAGDLRREAECLASHHEAIGESVLAARAWLRLGARESAARCFEKALEHSEAAALWEELGDPGAARRCRALAAEAARDWTSAAKEWEAMDEWEPAARCWANAGQPNRRLRCLANASERSGAPHEAAPRWEQLGEWQRAAALWRKAGRAGEAQRADAMDHETAGRWAQAAEAWSRLGDAPRSLRCQAEWAEHERRWEEAAAARESLGEFPAAIRAWKRAGKPDEARRCELRCDVAEGRFARAAEAFERGGELAAAADAWRRAHEAGQQPLKPSPLPLPAAAAKRWVKGGGPAKLLAPKRWYGSRYYAYGWEAPPPEPIHDALTRARACGISAAEAAGRFDDAERLWTELEDPGQALRCRVARLEQEGRHAAIGDLLEKRGWLDAAARAYERAGQRNGRLRCEARAFEKKGKFDRAAETWEAIGEPKRALRCRAQFLQRRHEYSQAAEIWESAGEEDAAFRARLAAAQITGNLVAAIRLAEQAGLQEIAQGFRADRVRWLAHGQWLAQQRARLLDREVRRTIRQAEIEAERSRGAGLGGRRMKPKAARPSLSVRARRGGLNAGNVEQPSLFGDDGSDSARVEISEKLPVIEGPADRGEPREGGTPADLESLLATVRKNPGLRCEELALLTGHSTERLKPLLKQAVFSGSLRQTGHTRGTRYWGKD